MTRRISLRRFEKLSPSLAFTGAWGEGPCMCFITCLSLVSEALSLSSVLSLLLSLSSVRLGIEEFRCPRPDRQQRICMLGLSFMEALRSFRALQWQSDGQPVSRNKECRCNIMSSRQIAGLCLFLSLPFFILLSAAHYLPLSMYYMSIYP